MKFENEFLLECNCAAFATPCTTNTNSLNSSLHCCGWCTPCQCVTRVSHRFFTNAAGVSIAASYSLRLTRICVLSLCASAPNSETRKVQEKGRERGRKGSLRRSKMHRQIIDKIRALHGFLFHFKFHAFCIFPSPAHICTRLCSRCT